MKRISIVFFSAFFILSLFGSIAYGFSDVTSSSPFYRAITFLDTKNIVEGYADKSFRPNNSISRAEFLAIAMRAKGINPSSTTYRDCFNDVSREWFAPYVCYAAKQGWVNGNTTRFRPQDFVNRAEGAKMLLEVFDIDIIPLTTTHFLNCDDRACKQWYGDYANTLKARNLLDFDMFQGEMALTRGEMAEMVFRTFVMDDFGVVRFHPSQGELYARTNGSFTLPTSYSSTSSSSSFSTGETTAFQFDTNPVLINFANTTDETYLKNRKAPFLQTDADTTYYVGYEEKSAGDWNPILVRFDNGRRSWYRTDFETQQGSKSYAYGIFELYGNIYILFATQGEAGSSQTDYRRATSQGWIQSYGTDTGKGEYATVIARINPDTGAMERGTYVSGIYLDSLRTASTMVTNMTESNSEILVSATTSGVPRRPDLRAVDQAGSVSAPRNFTFSIPTSLTAPSFVEFNGTTYNR